MRGRLRQAWNDGVEEQDRLIRHNDGVSKNGAWGGRSPPLYMMLNIFSILADRKVRKKRKEDKMKTGYLKIIGLLTIVIMMAYVSGCSSSSKSSPTKPSAPANLTATAADAQVTLSWSASTGATNYKIYDSTTSGGPYTMIGFTTSTSYTVTGLTNGTAYYFVVTALNSVGESSYSNEASATPAMFTVAYSFSATSGTINAVNLNSMFYESIAAYSGSTTGTIDPNSISISISPSLNFTSTTGFSGGAFDGYVFITPNGFLPVGTTYSVTTSFNATINSVVYPVTEYSTFTTISNADSLSVVPGDSFIITVTNVSQPPSLGTLLSGNIPDLAISVVTGTIASNPAAAGADGSMILYGGQAANTVSPTDITSYGFGFPSAAIYKGNELISSGSVTLSVSGISIPLQAFNLSGVVNSGSITNGMLYAVVHCTDMSCTNLGTTVGPIIAQYIDNNGNMVILGSFSAVPNTVPAVTWIGGGDTAHTTLVNGMGSGVTTATLEVTTTTSPLLSTATLPYIILTQTDSNNMLSLVAGGQGSPALPQSSPITLTYPLTTPSGTTYATTAGVGFTAYYMFGLTPALTTQVTP